MFKQLLLALILSLSYSTCLASDFWEPYDIPCDMPITGIYAVPNGTLYAVGFGIHVSTDNGLTWQAKGKYNYQGTDYNFELMPALIQNIVQLKNGTLLFGLSDGPMFKSKDNLETIETLNGIQNIRAFAEDSNGIIYVGNDNSFSVSSDSGETWIKCALFNYFVARDIKVSDQNEVFCATGKGLSQIIKEDGIWVYDSTEKESISLNTFIFRNGFILAGSDSGIYKTTDKGKTWLPLNKDIIRVQTLASGADGRIFAGTEYTGLYYSDDDGITWRKMKLYDGIEQVNKIVTIGNEVYVASAGMYYSSDNGANWELRNNGLGKGYGYVFFDSKNNVYANTQFHILKRSSGVVGKTDNLLDNWVDLNKNLPAPYVSDDGYVNPFMISLIDQKDNIYITSNDKMYVSGDEGNTWNSLVIPLEYIRQCLTDNNGNIYFFGYDTLYYRSILLSYNPENGNFVNITGFQDQYPVNLIQYIAIDDNGDIYALRSDSIFVTKNYGTTWDGWKTSLPDSTYTTVSRFEVVGGHLFITEDDKFYYMDNDSNWQLAMDGLEMKEDFETNFLIKKIRKNIYSTSSIGIYKYNPALNKWENYNYELNWYPLVSVISGTDNSGRLYIMTLNGTYRTKDPVPLKAEDNNFAESGNGCFYPNPSSDNSVLKITGVNPGSSYTLKLYNAYGETVPGNRTGVADADEISLQINTVNLSSGSYYAIFSQAGKTSTIPFVVVK